MTEEGRVIFMGTRRRALGSADRRGREAASCRQPGAERARRPLLTAAERTLAEEVAAHVGRLRESGDHWEHMLVSIDEAWPGAKYRVVLTGIFLAQLAYERRRRRAVLQ